MNNFAPHLKLEVGSALAAGSVAAADRWNDLLKTIPLPIIGEYSAK